MKVAIRDTSPNPPPTVLSYSHDPFPLFSNCETTSTRLILSRVQFCAPQYKKDIDLMKQAEGHQKGQRAGSHGAQGEGETWVCSASSREGKGETLLLLQLPNQKIQRRWSQTLLGSAQW